MLWVSGWVFFASSYFLGAWLEVLNNPQEQKQDILASSIVLHKVPRAKSYGFGELLTTVTKNALLHHVIRNVGQQHREVSKREKLRGKTMSWKGCWLSSQLTDLFGRR